MPGQFRPISSFQNPRIKIIKRLRNKRDRERDQRFVIDDTRDLARALQCNYAVDFALYCPELAADGDDALAETLPADRVFTAPRDLMAKVSYRQNPSSMLAVMDAKPLKGVDRLDEISPGIILTLVNLRKPGNIGALLRTADAAGRLPVMLVDTAIDMYNPNIIRSSAGASFLDNVYHSSSDAALSFFAQHNYRLAAAVVDGETSLFEANFSGNVALALGTEDDGLDDRWRRHADIRVSIPMHGVISDSLNVSVSGAVMMYEAMRQRL